MAILDKLSELASDFYPTTFSTGRSLFSHVIDLRAPSTAPNAIAGLSDGLYLVAQVKSAFLSSGLTTVALELVSDAQSAIATDGTATLHFSTGPMPLSQLTAGRTVMCVPITPAMQAERFLGVLQNVDPLGAPLTGGRISVFLTNDPPHRRNYADNVA